MDDKNLPVSLCALDLYREAQSYDSSAHQALMASWEAGDRSTSFSGISCITPCLLRKCTVTLSLDFGAEPPVLRNDDPDGRMISGDCSRQHRSLDMLALQARAESWPAYTENDVRPSDPNYMDY